MNTHTLALLALALSVLSQAINVVKLIRELARRRLQRLERRLGFDTDDTPADVITLADITEIHLRPRDR